MVGLMLYVRRSVEGETKLGTTIHLFEYAFYGATTTSTGHLDVELVGVELPVHFIGVYDRYR